MGTMGVDLRTFLERQGITQDEAAAGTGLSQGSISELCRRVKEPQFRTAMAVARWCNRIATARKLPPSQRLDIRQLHRLAA